MKRIRPEPSPSLCVATASTLVALVAAVAATALATAAAVAVISGSGAGSSLGAAIFIAAVLAAAASGLLAACIAVPPAATSPPATISADSQEKQIVLPLTTFQDGLKTLLHITKSRQPRPSRRRLPKKQHVREESLATPAPHPPPSDSLAFHERCGRILHTCDLLIRHFPATRTLCILRTAEGILARRSHLPVEPETTCESDIDVDLDPVLSAPDLDEALRRLDQRIRLARKYKERNELLQSTSLVLEAEKRRAIRSTAEQYLVDDAPPADTPLEPLPPDSIVEAAGHYPKPKARSSILQCHPTDTSQYLPTPETNESISDGVSPTCLCSTEAETTGLTSSRYDFTSSIVEMNSELYSTNDSSLQKESEMFSSTSLEKETENVAISPCLAQSTFTPLCVESDPEIPQAKTLFPSTSPVNEGPSSSLIESEDATSNFTQNEERLSSIEETKTPSLRQSSSMTVVENALPKHMTLVAELSEDGESTDWSSLVQIVAYGLHEEPDSPSSTSIEMEDSVLPLSKSKAGSKHSDSEKADAASLAGTVLSSSTLVDTEDLSPPFPYSEAVSQFSVSEKTCTPLLVYSSSASVDKNDSRLPSTKSEAIKSSSFSEMTGISSLAQTVLSSTASIDTEDSSLPSTNSEGVRLSSVSEKTVTSTLAKTVSSSSASVDTEDSSILSTTSDNILPSFICEKTDASLSTLHSLSIPSIDSAVKTEESSLPVTNNEVVPSLVHEEVLTSSSDDITLLPSAAVISDTATHSFLDLHEKLEVPDMTENIDKPALATDLKSTTIITDNEIPILQNIPHGNDIERSAETASAEYQLDSHFDDQAEDSIVNSSEKTDKGEDIPSLSEVNQSLRSTLTLDLGNVATSKIELEFEQLLGNTSPYTDDIDKSFTAVSSGISELNKNVYDKGEDIIDTCVSVTAKDVNKDTGFPSHVEVEQKTFMENDPKILISESKLSLPDLTPEETLEPSTEKTNLRTHVETSDNEDMLKSTNQPSLTSTFDESFVKTVPTLINEDDYFNETEAKFDSERQSYDINLGSDVMSDCASDSSSMSVSPNADISFLRTETNLAVESSADTIKVFSPEKKKDLPQQTMHDFGFGEPLMVVTARKVATYVDDPVCSTQRNFRQKRRVRISTEDFDPRYVSEVQERKIGLVRPSVEQRGAIARHRFAPVCRELSPPEINICKPLKPEALRPFGGCVRDAVRPEGRRGSDAPLGHFYRSLERREEARPPNFDHSSSFPLSMRVPHRRAFWDYKLNEPKSESPKRQESIKATGIVRKCKETFQTKTNSPDDSSPLAMDEGDLPGNHRRRFQEAKCFFQNLAGGSRAKIPAEPASKPDSKASVKPRKRMLPATVQERFNVTGIYQDVLGDGAAKTATGAPLRGVPRREAVVATLHSFRK